MTTMYIQCCVCREFIDSKETSGNAKISHGICPECFDEEIKKSDKTGRMAESGLRRTPDSNKSLIFHP